MCTMKNHFWGGLLGTWGLRQATPIHQVAFFLRREFSIHNVRQTQRSPPASSILCVGKVDKSLGLEVSISSEDRGRLHIQHSNWQEERILKESTFLKVYLNIFCVLLVENTKNGPIFTKEWIDIIVVTVINDLL